MSKKERKKMSDREYMERAHPDIWKDIERLANFNKGVKLREKLDLKYGRKIKCQLCGVITDVSHSEVKECEGCGTLFDKDQDDIDT